ncbi:neuroglian [Lingula anatina]|uniref:Neuroglian n=1 Tax=Lingula anatina TaxID=7574 RepID=A0A1S3HAS9_LINAN|nr:neuroglian [Lingula anatina]|eukprot:XP_013382229.1 neuroglian [Lingula anatina]
MARENAVFGIIVLGLLYSCYLVEDVHGQCTDLWSGPTEYPPYIDLQPDQLMQFKKRLAFTMECQASGNPAPTYTWYKNGQPFNPSGDTTMMTGLGNLNFANPKENDAGIYQCVATNSKGTAVTHKVMLVEAIQNPFLNLRLQVKKPAVGQPFKLECENVPQTYPEPEITWEVEKKRGSRRSSFYMNDRVTLDHEGNLYFANVIPDDSMNGRPYACKVNNPFLRSSVMGPNVKLEPSGTISSVLPYAPILLWSSPSKVDALKDDVVQIKCIFGGYPTPRIKWYRKNGDISEPLNARGSSYEIEDYGMAVLFPRISYDDAQRYQCVGENTQGQSSHDIEISVESIPELEKEPTNIDIEEAETVRVECVAKGMPTPVTEWFINGKPLKDVPLNPRRTDTLDYIEFTDLRKEDSAVIQCNASNENGYVFVNGYLNVMAEEPHFIQCPEPSVKKVVGDSANITCRIFGAPKPDMTWKLKDEVVSQGQVGTTGGDVGGARFVREATGNLIIKNLEKEDSGFYLCEAVNTYGHIQQSGELIVRYPTVIDNPPGNVRGTAGSVVTINCTASTDPEEEENLIVTWMKNGVKIDIKSNPRYRMNPDNSLVIDPAYVSDTADFSCNASNGLDSVVKSGSLVVSSPPGPPVDVLVDECGTRQARISWSKGAENNARILLYIIEYSVADDPGNWEQLKNISAPYSTVTLDLAPYKSYSFRVRAQNEAGIGEPSAVTENTKCTTPPEIPEKNPDNPRTEDRRPKTLVVLWDPLTKDELNGPGFHYKIRYRRTDLDRNTPFSEATVDDPDQGEIVIDSDTYRPYEIYVEAVNDIGTAQPPAQRITGFSGEGKPSIFPENFREDEDEMATADTVFVRWSPVKPEPETVKGKFMGYQIQYWLADEDESKMKRINVNATEETENSYGRGRRAADDVKASIPDLPPYAAITAQVAVRNRRFVGDACPPIDIKTAEGAPGPITNFEVSAKGPTLMDLKWEPPLVANGILTGYTIEYRTANESEDLGPVMVEEVTDPTQLTLRLSDLEPATNYRITLRAETGGGLGEELTRDAETMVMCPPNAPIVDIVAAETSMSVSWTPASDNPGTTFYVEYRRPDDNTWIRIPAEEGVNSVDIGRLDPGMEYEVRVIASNDPDSTEFETASPIETVRMAGAAALTEELGPGIWFAILLAIIILLIIILLLFCCIRRKSQNKYNVEEKEKLRPHSNGPQFSEFSRGAPGSQEPLEPEDADRPESESDSMDQYGENELGKFNEDGSFIGQYGRSQPGAKGQDSSRSAMQTFV